MATLEGFSIPFFPSIVNILTWGSHFFMYGIIKQLPRSEITCQMCKDYKIAAKRFVFRTFEILPKTPSEDLIICEKCAIREFSSKDKNKFKEMFGK